jgi:hypothetical protein
MAVETSGLPLHLNYRLSQVGHKKTLHLLQQLTSPQSAVARDSAAIHKEDNIKVIALLDSKF